MNIHSYPGVVVVPPIYRAPVLPVVLMVWGFVPKLGEIAEVNICLPADRTGKELSAAVQGDGSILVVIGEMVKPGGTGRGVQGDGAIECYAVYVTGTGIGKSHIAGKTDRGDDGAIEGGGGISGAVLPAYKEPARRDRCHRRSPIKRVAERIGADDKVIVRTPYPRLR